MISKIPFGGTLNLSTLIDKKGLLKKKVYWPADIVKLWIFTAKFTNNSFCECLCVVFKEDVHKLSSLPLSHQPHFR